MQRIKTHRENKCFYKTFVSRMKESNCFIEKYELILFERVNSIKYESIELSTFITKWLGGYHALHFYSVERKIQLIIDVHFISGYA